MLGFDIEHQDGHFTPENSKYFVIRISSSQDPQGKHSYLASLEMAAKVYVAFKVNEL